MEWYVVVVQYCGWDGDNCMVIMVCDVDVDVGQRTRDRMIKEKERLLEDGVLSAEETAFFMRKYK